MAGRIPLEPGTVIMDGSDAYEIVSDIGYGGSAVIYRAIEKSSGNYITLKEIYPSSSPVKGIAYVRDAHLRVTPAYEAEVMPACAGDDLPACAGDDLPAGAEKAVPAGVEKSKETPPDRAGMARAKKFMNVLYSRLKKEEEIGRHLRDEAFLVCNLQILQHAHFEGREERLCGIAKMQNMNTSSIVLKERLAQLFKVYHGCIPLSCSLNILKVISETMEKIHRSGYLYCDFSLGNIFLLQGDKAAVFIDFGSAKKKTDSYVWTNEYIPATPGFRSPELSRSGQRTVILSEASDVYAVAVLFYLMVQGSIYKGGYDRDNDGRNDGRIVTWTRLKENGVTNPVAALAVNHIFFKGLERYDGERTASVRAFMKQLDFLDDVLHKEKQLFETLVMAYRAGYDGQDQALTHFFETAQPSPDLLYDAVEQLGRALLDNHNIKEMTYAFYWLALWWKKMDRTQGDASRTGRMEFLLSFCGLAVCNHRGDVTGAINHYKMCVSRKEEIEVPLFMGIRLRAAESYANFFSFKTAYRIAVKNCRILEKRKKLYRQIAASFDIHGETAVRSDELGKTASAAGRYCVFMGSNEPEYYEKALDYFKKALEEFEGSRVQTERTWCYILQLASCKRDRMLFDHYRKLYFGDKSVTEQIEALLSVLEVSPYGQAAYNLYALLKGIRRLYVEGCSEAAKAVSYVEGCSEAAKAALYVEGCSEAAETALYMEDIRTELSEQLKRIMELGRKYRSSLNHPWELIFRQTAVLTAETEKEVSSAAEELFHMSVQINAAADVERNLQEVRRRPFDTILVLHLMTLAEKKFLEIRYNQSEDNNERLQAQLDLCLSELYRYLRRHKCPLIQAKDWQQCGSAVDRYLLVRGCFNYEYD